MFISVNTISIIPKEYFFQVARLKIGDINGYHEFEYVGRRSRELKMAKKSSNHP